MASLAAFTTAIALAGCLMACAGMAVAADGSPAAVQPDTGMAFDIPAQPLRTALEQFMTATAYSGLYDSALTAGLYSAEVRGVMSPEAALRQLVAGSGLQVRYAAGNTFGIVAAGPLPAQAAAALPVPEAPQSGAQAVKGHYFSAVQAGIKDIFCRSAATTLGNYRIALSLWVGPSGEIEKVHLLDTGGSPQRDARIAAGLRSLRLPALPAGAAIRQPITMVLLPTPAGVPGDCVG
jgi:hypothetical protein